MGVATSAGYRSMAMAVAFLGALCLTATGIAQEAQHDHGTHIERTAPKANAGTLMIAFGANNITLVADALKSMPHKTITVHNSHTGAEEGYSGVLLSDLLARVDAPLGAKLHGKALAGYVLTAGSDGYQAIYSIAEIDPAFHSGDVIVADTLAGKPLADDGPFRLINTEDKRPARWVRNLVSIKLVTP